MGELTCMGLAAVLCQESFKLQAIGKEKDTDIQAIGRSNAIKQHLYTPKFMEHPVVCVAG